MIRNENHCWRCGRKFGSTIYAKSFPIPIGIVYREEGGGVLCDDCMNLELEEQMEKELGAKKQ